MELRTVMAVLPGRSPRRVYISVLSIDDFVFGVSAIGTEGQESLTSAHISPVRRSAGVKVVK